MTIAIIKLECTCEYCPIQYEGLLNNGMYIYFRYRHEKWRCTIAPSLNEATALYERKEIHSSIFHQFVGIADELTHEQAISIINNSIVDYNEYI